MNSDTFELVRASRALGISATYVSQAEEAAKSFENRVKHLIQQVVHHLRAEVDCQSRSCNLPLVSGMYSLSTQVFRDTFISL